MARRVEPPGPAGHPEHDACGAGRCCKVADYDTVKKRLLGSRYTMDFSSGVNFNLDVITSDSMTAATMSSLSRRACSIRR